MHFIGLLFFLAFSLVSASNYEVSTINVQKTLYPEKNIYVTSPSKGAIQPMNGEPVILPNRVTMRRKYAGNEYGFYQGVLTPSAAKNLYHFDLEGMPPLVALKTKFYKRHGEKAFLDVQDVYVDAHGLYHSSVPVLWYMVNGTWKQLSSKGEKLSFFEFKVDGVDTEIFRNGQKVGRAPFVSGPQAKQGDAWVVDRPDFMPKALWRSPTPGLMQSVEDSLLPFPNWGQLVYTNSAYSIDSAMEMVAQEEFYRDALKEKKKLANLREEKRAVLEKSYYPKQRLLLSEEPYSKAYQEYLILHDSLLEVSLDELLKDLKSREKQIDGQIAEMDTLLERLWARKFTRVIEPTALKFKQADSTKNELALRVKFGFKDMKMPVGDGLWTGVALLEEKTLRAFQKHLREDKRDSVKLQIVWEAKPVRLGDDYQYHYFYYRFLEMNVEFKGERLPFIGNFSLPERVEKMPEVQEWLKRDSLRTIRSKQKAEEEALRKIELAKLAEKKEMEDLLMRIRGPVVDLPGGAFFHKGKTVELSPFGINQIEVTQEHFKWVTGENPSSFKSDQKPVHNVSWEKANKFCREVGGRLPTEAQWEFAARAATKTYFYWGRREISAEPYAVFEDNSQDRPKSDSLYGPQPVKSKKPNAWEIYDMAGNVAEWVKDYYTVWYMDYFVEKKDPQGPTVGGHFKVFKGGSWYDAKRDLEHVKLDWEDPRYWSDKLGFRCAFPYQQKMKKKEMQNRMKLYQKRHQKFAPHVGEEVLPPEASVEPKPEMIQETKEPEPSPLETEPASPSEIEENEAAGQDSEVQERNESSVPEESAQEKVSPQ